MANSIPFPERRERSAELLGLDHRLEDLRQKVESDADPLSVARSLAILHVDFIGRIVAFSLQLDEALGGRILLEDYPLQENLRRANMALRMYEQLMGMLGEATDQLFRCLGGKETITVQAIGEWAENNPVRREVLDQILKFNRAIKKACSAK